MSFSSFPPLPDNIHDLALLKICVGQPEVITIFSRLFAGRGGSSAWRDGVVPRPAPGVYSCTATTLHRASRRQPVATVRYEPLVSSCRITKKSAAW